MIHKCMEWGIAHRHGSPSVPDSLLEDVSELAFSCPELRRILAGQGSGMCLNIEDLQCVTIWYPLVN